MSDLAIPEDVYEHPDSIEAFTAAQLGGRIWVAGGLRATPVDSRWSAEIDEKIQP